MPSKTIVRGGADQLEAAIDAILAGGTPDIVQIIEPKKGYWIIIHKA